MSLGITVNKEKNGLLMAYIAEQINGVTLRKLLKITYLIDEKFMKQRGFPLTWFDYYAWEKGPVAPEVYEIKNGAFHDFVRCRKNGNGSNVVESLSMNNCGKMDLFSQYELSLVDEVISQYKDKSADELSEITHRCNSLWSKVVAENDILFVDGKSDVVISLQRLNEGDSAKEETYDEALDYMQFCSLM